MTASLSFTSARPRAIGWWLLAVAALVFAMVVVGGATRLTESGLSIVEWKPVTGALPPMSEAAWQAEFAAYKTSPQYHLVNQGMSLAAFKTIFWWEWGHRLLGRAIGLAFLLPFLWFLLRRAIPRGLAPRLWFIFLLGAAQGALGWWMVKSGLVAEPAVSHYRLAAHLGLALVIFAALLWTALDLLTQPRRRAPARAMQALAWGFLILLGGQIILGAFVAGLDAGLAYNSWPLMDGAFIPAGVFAAPNIFDDTLAVQFLHRMLAYAVTLLAGLLVIAAWRRESDRPAQVLTLLLLLATLAQAGLGIATLLAQVPVGLGTAHQGGAVLLLGLGLALAHRQKARPAHG
ncbi:MAG: COX15/CtaA family protein [Pseudomonadota bacterium]